MAVLPIAPYDPSRVIQQFGSIVPSAYGPDSRISITPTGASFTVMQGQDGHIIRVKQRAVHHLLVFTLMKSDPANDLLDELFRNDVESLLPSGIVKYQLTDNNGTSKCTAAYAWISQQPDLTYTAAGEAYTWNAVLASADVRTRALTFLP